jgi:starch synthase
MRINIVTSGRFHVLDLARELAMIGHEVRFYSLVPRARAERFGLPARCHRATLLWLIPLLLLSTRGPRLLRAPARAALERLLDRTAAALMEPCDAFIGMSGLCIRSARKARAQGAKVFIERGSRHIVSQKRILDSIAAPGVSSVRDDDVARELASYAAADVIVVPSRHADESFVDHGVPSERLFRNPYGVDLGMFPATTKPAHAVPVALMAGTWSLQKGCDLLWQACRSAGHWRLRHVGSPGDAPLPFAPLFEHRAAVPQWELARQFGDADILVLPSRQDGFGMVLVQALACGLPVVCTDRTGGPDIRELLDEPKWVTVVPHDDAGALGAGVQHALSLASGQSGLRDILGSARDRLSWAAYAGRYDMELTRRCSR